MNWGSIIYSSLDPKKTKIKTTATIHFPTTIFTLLLEIPVWDVKEQRWCPTWLQRVIITCSEGLQDQVFRETFKITQPFTCFVGFTGLQRPFLVIDFSIWVRTWRPEEAEIPWSLISEETDGALRQSEEGFWRGAPDGTLQPSSFPWGAPWSRSYLWALRESRLRYLVISPLHKFVTWSQETENRTSTMCDKLCASGPRAGIDTH